MVKEDNDEDSLKPNKEMPSPIPKDTSEDLIKLENQLLNIAKAETNSREVLRDITLEEMNTSRLCPNITLDSIHESDKKLYNQINNIKIEQGNPIELTTSEMPFHRALFDDKELVTRILMKPCSKKSVKIKSLQENYEGKNGFSGRKQEIKGIGLNNMETTSSIPRLRPYRLKHIRSEGLFTSMKVNREVLYLNEKKVQKSLSKHKMH